MNNGYAGTKSYGDVVVGFNKIKSIYNRITQEILNSTGRFMERVSETWEAPKAVSFAQYYKTEIDENVCAKFYRDLTQILNTAANKVNEYWEALDVDGRLGADSYDIQLVTVDVSQVKANFPDGSYGIAEGFDVEELIRYLDQLKHISIGTVQGFKDIAYEIFSSYADGSELEQAFESLANAIDTNMENIEDYAANALEITRDRLAEIRNKNDYNYRETTR